jgi:hypothetical protein
LKKSKSINQKVINQQNSSINNSLSHKFQKKARAVSSDSFNNKDNYTEDIDKSPDN